MKTAAVIQENAEDIYAEAQQINEERAAQDADAVVEDDFKEVIDEEEENASEEKGADAVEA